MKLKIPKDWIKKFVGQKDDPMETIPIGPMSKLCGCGNPVEADCAFCAECIAGYRGEDEI